jgi:hypothetical protein
MSDPNPYEPPRALVPLTKGQVVKRGLGLVALLLLTPLAVGIAALVSCGITGVFVGATLKRDGSNVGVVSVVGWILFLIPPVTAFFWMLWLAGRGNETDSSRRETNESDAGNASSVSHEGHDKK